MVISKSVDASYSVNASNNGDASNCRTPVTIGIPTASGTPEIRTDGKDGTKPIKAWKLAKKHGRRNISSASNSMNAGNSSGRKVSGDDSARE